MPELPEVETTRLHLLPHIIGRECTDVQCFRSNLRLPLPPLARELTGLCLEQIERRAKYLLFHFSQSKVMLAHLGMSGRFLLQPTSLTPPAKHEHVRFHFGDLLLAYHDPRRFGLLTMISEPNPLDHPLLAKLGLEPLAAEFTAPRLSERLSNKKAPIKGVLMDQQVVVGVGNIYASESLHLAGINPLRPANSLRPKECELLVTKVREVLLLALEAGGSSIRDFQSSSGAEGYFQVQFKVYGRKGLPCYTCSTPLAALNIAGRASFFCSKCQPAS